MIDLLNEGVEATVSPTVRETCDAVAELWEVTGQKPVSVTELARHLGLDKSATSRRVRVAVEKGYLVNLEERRGKPALLTPGEPLPDEAPVLPRPEELTIEKNVCSIPPCNTATVQHLPGETPLPDIGDKVWCVDGAGVTQNPEPLCIVDIVDGPDGADYALFEGTSTGWPLERCIPAALG